MGCVKGCTMGLLYRILLLFWLRIFVNIAMPSFLFLRAIKEEEIVFCIFESV